MRLAIASLLLLSGCASGPISYSPDSPVKRCVQYKDSSDGSHYWKAVLVVGEEDDRLMCIFTRSSEPRALPVPMEDVRTRCLGMEWSEFEGDINAPVIRADRP